MWFLLSLNLSHWIGSFSTVGLDSHLGFRQKGLREAKHFTFHFLWEEEKRAEERGGTHIEEACWRVFQWDRISRSHFYCCTETEVVRLAFIAGMHFQKGYGCIYCRHEFRGRSTDSVQFSFGARFSRKIRHRFRGRNLAHFSRNTAWFLRPYDCI